MGQPTPRRPSSAAVRSASPDPAARATVVASRTARASFRTTSGALRGVFHRHTARNSPRV